MTNLDLRSPTRFPASGNRRSGNTALASRRQRTRISFAGSPVANYTKVEILSDRVGIFDRVRLRRTRRMTATEEDDTLQRVFPRTARTDLINAKIEERFLASLGPVEPFGMQNVQMTEFG